MAQDYAAPEEDMYSDMPETVAPPEPEVPEETVPEEAPVEPEDTGEDRTALLPKASFMGKDLKPGTRCEFEIVRVHDDEVEVKYVPHEESAEAAPAAPAAPPPGMDQLAELMG